jgi:arabinose operon protein AraL
MVGVVVDLDGTVYRGESLIPGADTALRRLRDAGYGVVFATNKSIAHPKDYVDKLAALGVDAEVGDLVTVNAVLARHLLGLLGDGGRVLVVGEAPLWEELTAAGLRTPDRLSLAEAVAMGWDRAFDYAKLDAVFQAGRHGLPIVATNPDVTCPVEDGEVPDCGMQIAALEAGLGRQIDATVGKPHAVMARTATERLGLEPHECWMVGDRVATDMRMAREAGLHGALVLSGVTTARQAEDSPWRPELVADDLPAVADALLGTG